MRILIHVPGEFNDGMDSNVRGEGRWSLNFGHMMALHGHDVTLVGNPGRGHVPGCRVLPLGHPDMWDSWDVFHDTTYWKPRGEEIDARVHIHGYWAFDDIAQRVRQDYGPGHYTAIATYQQWAMIPDDAKAFTYLMPFPVAESIFWERSNFGRRGLYWNVKYGFEDNWDVKRSVVTHALLHIALDLAEELNEPLQILHGEHIVGGGGAGTTWHQELRRFVNTGIRVNMRPDLVRRLTNHPMVSLIGECAWRQSLEVLAASRLMITNGDPPVSPMPVEAVALGTVPLQWTTNIFEYSGPWAFTHSANPEYYTHTVKPALRMLLTHRDVYEEVLGEFRRAAVRYTYAEAYPICANALDEMLAG